MVRRTLKRDLERVLERIGVKSSVYGFRYYARCSFVFGFQSRIIFFFAEAINAVRERRVRAWKCSAL